MHSGAAYSKNKVRIEGTSKVYARGADSGNENRFHFCPNCGSNVYWEGDKFPDDYGITVGSFTDPNFPPPTYSLFEASMHPWLRLPPQIDHFSQGEAVMPSR
jgi:hypothetical protein